MCREFYRIYRFFFFVFIDLSAASALELRHKPLKRQVSFLSKSCSFKQISSSPAFGFMDALSGLFLDVLSFPVGSRLFEGLGSFLGARLRNT